MKIIPKSGAWVFVVKNVPTVCPVHMYGIYYAKPSGTYFWEGECSPWNYDYTAFDQHPTTGKDLYDLLRVFGSMKDTKDALVSLFMEGKKASKLTPEQLRTINSYGKDKLKRWYPIEAQVSILTEYGEVCLNPNEYSILSTEHLLEFLEQAKDGHAFIRYLSESKQLRGRVADHVFYLRTPRYQLFVCVVDVHRCCKNPQPVLSLHAPGVCAIVYAVGGVSKLRKEARGGDEKI